MIFRTKYPSKPTLRQETHSCGGEKQEQRIPSTNSVPLRVSGAKTPRQQPDAAEDVCFQTRHCHVRIIVAWVP